MSGIQRLRTEEELNVLLESSKDAGVFIFKHSTSCPISAHAYEEVKKFIRKGHHGEVIGLILVIEDRSLSQGIAKRFGIKHESPQTLYIKEGTHVAWDASHGEITEENLEKAKQT
ncbi:bacillithiol system redox-active protein YtxJ [Hazenella coriacea]|uniref:Bacillithiol system protein YtxJ n=1 Tax=Hazenella coriacea TaxID=1179467 RepID=A0A4R3L6M4_9BACL|nr:bacillithiol system redox-active protein YtxJ [Hazenella coriacea]TCS95072.1 bacillithiol system protein YtxJ [Hazenella coriacea]